MTPRLAALALSLVLVPPPHALFDGSPESGSFEPSAAAHDAATGHVVVLSDKDDRLYRYELRDGRLVPPAGRVPRLRVLGPDGRAVECKKFEALTPLGGSPGTYLAATTFDREPADYHRLARFRYHPVGDVTGGLVPLDEAGLAAAVRRATGRPWFKVEGLTTNAAGDRVFVGVRQVGASYKQAENVVAVFRCRYDGERVSAPRRRSCSRRRRRSAGPRACRTCSATRPTAVT